MTRRNGSMLHRLGCCVSLGNNDNKPMENRAMNMLKAFCTISLKAAGVLLFACLACTVQAKDNTVKVVCIGEQTTHSAHRENDPEYPIRMAGILGKGYEVLNFGLPKGRVLKDAPAPDAEEYLNSEPFKLSTASNPNIVVIGPFGRHDTYEGNWPEHKAEFENDLADLVKRYMDLPSQPKVYVVLPLPFNGADDHAITGLLAPTKAVAEKYSLEVIDLWTPFMGHAEWYKDGTHLTPKGQQKQAELVAAAISQ